MSNHKRLVVVSAGTGNPSSTRQLTDRIAQKSLDLLAPATVDVIELGPLAVDIARAAVAGFPGEQLQAAIDRLAACDKLPAAIRDELRGVYEQAAQQWRELPDDELFGTAAGCRAAADAVQKAAGAVCGW